MFTGLVEDIGRLVARQSTGNDGKLTIETALPLAEIAIGDSIAVNGACLTVETYLGNNTLVFHTLAETLRRTNLGQIPPGAPVNLERAMRLGDRLGGHLVQGHVDATAPIRHIIRSKNDLVVAVELPDTLAHLVIEKGSIAVNGISLTIAKLDADTFTVHLIPHTWQATNLKQAKVGDPLNLEADMVGKYILRQHQIRPASQTDISMHTLEMAGW